MYLPWRKFSLLFLAIPGVFSSVTSFAAHPPAPAQPLPLRPIHAAETPLPGFTEAEILPAVRALIANFEATTDRPLVPGKKRRAGLKVSCEGAPGLNTSPALVRAIITVLLERGFTRQELFLADRRETRLREAGFLPPLSQSSEKTFEGVPVHILEEPRWQDPAWFYESPLPSGRVPPLSSLLNHPTTGKTLLEDFVTQDRRSALPIDLLLECDFWISLPIVTDSDALGLSGALANISLLAITNNHRFLKQPTQAAVAAAEIAAIPELRQTCAFSLLLLQNCQAAGGYTFLPQYAWSEPALWLSTSAAAIDARILPTFNRHRARFELKPAPDPLPANDYLQGCLPEERQPVTWRKLQPQHALPRQSPASPR